LLQLSKISKNPCIFVQIFLCNKYFGKQEKYLEKTEQLILEIEKTNNIM